MSWTSTCTIRGTHPLFTSTSYAMSSPRVMSIDSSPQWTLSGPAAPVQSQQSTSWVPTMDGCSGMNRMHVSAALCRLGSPLRLELSVSRLTQYVKQALRLKGSHRPTLLSLHAISRALPAKTSANCPARYRSNSRHESQSNFPALCDSNESSAVRYL